MGAIAMAIIAIGTILFVEAEIIQSKLNSQERLLKDILEHLDAMRK